MEKYGLHTAVHVRILTFVIKLKLCNYRKRQREEELAQEEEAKRKKEWEKQWDVS